MKIKNLKLKINAGFTLIEMLIVIAVIGVLAIAVLSAINPVEQMRKARDTRRKSNAAELLNAIERYYATNEVNPPTMTVGADDTCDAALTGGNVDVADLGDLISANELKAEFETRITGAPSDYLYVGINSTTELVAVCHQIESRANIDKYTGAPNHCTSGAPPLDYACLPE